MDKLTFKEYHKKSSNKSSVWNFYLRTDDGLYAKCKECNKILKCQNTTTSLHMHLKLHRERGTEITENEPSTSSIQVVAQKRPQRADTASEPLRKKSRIDDYFCGSEDTMENMVSKMTACDGLPFSIFCTSESIRKLFLKSGYKDLPKSPNTIKKIVVTKSDEIKRDLRQELSGMKAKNTKFSVTLDEWTSDSNRRYINVNIHSPHFKDKPFRNLGLARINGRGTAERCVNILQNKLAGYDLHMEKDIACAVTDGASVMCSLGRKVPCFHQQCLAHGIQCAVVDAIYKNDPQALESMEESVTYCDSDNASSDCGDSDTEEENYGLVIQQGNVPKKPTLMHNKELIDKVRNVVKFFKKSPTKTEVLSNYLIQENKNLQLILDCKTRWSSLANMIERFLKIKDSVMKALIDLKNKVTFSAEDFCILEDLSSSLNVVKATVEAICQENANLLTAEAALQFMMNKLQLQSENSIVSKRLFSALKDRITQRRQAELICTLKYLHNPTRYYNEWSEHSDTFPNVGNDVITNMIVEINKKFFDNNHQNLEHDDTTQIQSPEPDTSNEGREPEETEISIKKQLQKSIDDTMFASASTSAVNLENEDEFETSVRMEMALFDRGGPRQLHLSQAYSFLMCIPPTSVECERVFSSTKYISNHLRCALKDDSIDALSFLRSYYQKK